MSLSVSYTHLDVYKRQLFDRLGRSIRLTEAGRAFIPRARAILEQMEAARSRAGDQNTDLRGSVAVGVIPTVAPYLIPSYACLLYTSRCV